MRKATTFISVLGLAAGLALLVQACSTDSPTAPQQNPPPPGGGTNPTAYKIEILADPDELDVNTATTTGQICSENNLSTLRITVRERETNRLPPDGTTILIETNLGTFEPMASLPVQAIGAELVNGRVFVNFYSCSTAGTATIRVSLGSSIQERRIIIRSTPLVARWTSSNPDANLSVQFNNTSVGEPDSFEWRFGDGQTSVEFSPHHVYATPGTYGVTLTVTKGQRTDECRTTISTDVAIDYICNEPPTDPPAP
jgi:PKD repeat protein